MSTSNANAIIQRELTTQISSLEDILEADVITYIGPITGGLPDLLKSVIESMQPKRGKLAFLLETEGGYVEEAERVVNILRHHYSVVDFVVTGYAMSAGTVLVMSGDAIYMDYSAVLGPIDPQIQRPGGNALVPALGYLEQYDRLVKKSANGSLTSAELAYLIDKFDPAELYYYEQARELSIALLKEWLVRYKFKNWTVTATRGKPVTTQQKKLRAQQIAKQLNETKHWHSHSRGISMDVLRRELNLQIEDIADTPKLQEALLGYTGLLNDYRGKQGHDFFVLNWKAGYHGH